jgi:WD40 repeat protein
MVYGTSRGAIYQCDLDRHPGTADQFHVLHDNAINAIAMLSAQLIVTANLDGIRVFDLTGTPRWFREDVGPVTAVLPLSASDASEWLASAGADGTVRIWDATGNCLHAAPTGHTGGITALALVGNDVLATASDDGTVRLWDLVRQSPIAT